MNDIFSIRKDGASTFIHGYLEEEGNTTLHKQTKQAKFQPSARLLCHLGRDNLLQDPQRYALLCRKDGIISQQLMQENMASPPIPQLHEYGDEGFLRRGHNL